MRSPLQRLIYRHVTADDKAKIRAESNVADTGGGARDVRFGPWREFEPVIIKMFPDVEVQRKKRGGDYEDVPVRKRELQWLGQDGAIRTMEVEFWPPTPARKAEGRLAQVARIEPFQPASFPGEGDQGVFYFIWEDDNGLWGRYLTEQQLRSDEIDPEIAEPILSGLEAVRREGKGNPRGFVDYTESPPRTGHFDV